jgi:hypothetical protein
VLRVLGGEILDSRLRGNDKHWVPGRRPKELNPRTSAALREEAEDLLGDDVADDSGGSAIWPGLASGGGEFVVRMT